jgi:Holliday junction resolvasome RuvABC endonuclease subunit
MANRKNIAGIDPGQATGAICIFSPDGEIIYLQDLPTLKIHKKKKNSEGKSTKSAKTLLDGHELRKILIEHSVGYACIEKVHAMSKNGFQQGIASTASFMEAYGLIKGILIGLNISFVPVTPQSWKKATLNGYGKEKGSSVSRVKDMYPNLVLKSDRARKDNHNWADAVCLGEYGYKFLKNRNIGLNLIKEFTDSVGQPPHDSSEG